MLRNLSILDYRAPYAQTGDATPVTSLKRVQSAEPPREQRFTQLTHFAPDVMQLNNVTYAKGIYHSLTLRLSGQR